jgi:hypothetical protein
MQAHRLDDLRHLAEEATDECVVPTWGFGTLRFEGKTLDAARVMWVIHRGDPGDLLVLHNCGRGGTGCVNLRHLYLGNHRQNLLDRYRDRGSDRTGLTANDVREIRSRSYEKRGSKIATAREYGINRSTLDRILGGISWGWVD